MCGIHGLITTEFQQKGDNFIKEAFIANTLRGMDASGIVSISPKSKNFALQKLPVPGYMFLYDKYANQLMSRADMQNTLTICHTRSATVGTNGITNAHPFVVQDKDKERTIIGVHNGTLYGWEHKPNGKNYAVDSNWALAHIFNNGQEAFRDFRGAFVLVWWDSADAEHLNIALNDQRPMHIALTKKKGMAFASEPGMLSWLLERNEIETAGKAGNIMYLKAGNHYKFPLGSPSNYEVSAFPTPPVAAAVVTTHPTAMRRATTFEEMDKFVASLKAKVTGGSSKASSKGSSKERESQAGKSSVDTTGTAGTSGRAILVKPRVTRAEIDKALATGLHGKEGVVIPWYYDDDDETILCTYEGTDGEDHNAIIRNGADLSHTLATRWFCRVIGAIEEKKDGKEEITLILSRPAEESVTAH